MSFRSEEEKRAQNRSSQSSSLAQAEPASISRRSRGNSTLEHHFLAKCLPKKCPKSAQLDRSSGETAELNCAQLAAVYQSCQAVKTKHSTRTVCGQVTQLPATRTHTQTQTHTHLLTPGADFCLVELSWNVAARGSCCLAASLALSKAQKRPPNSS